MFDVLPAIFVSFYTFFGVKLTSGRFKSSSLDKISRVRCHKREINVPTWIQKKTLCSCSSWYLQHCLHGPAWTNGAQRFHDMFRCVHFFFLGITDLDMWGSQLQWRSCACRVHVWVFVCLKNLWALLFSGIHNLRVEIISNQCAFAAG